MATASPISRASSVGSSQTTEKNVQDYARLYAISPELAHWLVWHKTSRGHFTSFEKRAWQLGIITDPAPRKVVRKCSQIGMTEYAINQVFTFAALGKSGLYILPRDKDVGKFTPRRIDRLIKSVPYYAANCASGHKDSDSKSQKSLFGVDWQFTGSGVETNFYEVVADHLVIDEHDRCNQQNLIYAFDRLRSAAEPTWLKIGNPTVPGRGIDEQYEQSTKNAWHLKCPHCNEWQSLSWQKNVVRQDDSGHWVLRLDQCPIYSCDAGVVCAKCERAIDRLATGEWIAENQTALIAGYAVSAIFGDPRSAYGHDSIRELFAAFLEGEKNATAEQRFHNNLLGEPFAGNTSGISDAMLAECVQPDYRMPGSATETVAGVDVGKVLHVHISKVEYRDNVKCRRKVFMGTVPGFRELHTLFAQYGVYRSVIDGTAYENFVRDFQSGHPGAYMCHYRIGASEAQPQSINQDKRMVATNRTESLDKSLGAFRAREVILPINYPSVDNGDFVAQMKAPLKVWDEDGQRWRWEEFGKPDHHRHADNYERIAAGMADVMVTVL